MADYSVTATAVVASSTADVEHGKAGATITAGQWVYRDSSTGNYLLADSNSATAAAHTPRGVALNGGASGQPIAIAKSGPVTFNAVFTAGVAVYLSDTPGGMCPVADVGSGEYPCVLGLPSSTSVLNVGIQAAGVAL